MNTMRSELHAILLLVLQLCSIHAYASASSHTAAEVQCFPADAAALLQLKRSFLDPNLTSWRNGTNCCSWEGITCDTASGRVITLDLGGRYLRSRGLDPALFNLTALRNLSLADTDFMGARLPSFGFELLTEMVHLNFSNNNLCGQIPIGIARLRKLVTLDFASQIWYCLFLDEEPSFQTFIANLSSLRELSLDGVNISSSREAWSIALADSTPRLHILSLRHCGLTGSIHHSFSRLRSLVEIDLSYNLIAGKVPELFADFPLLSSLDLSYNDFKGQFPAKIFQLEKLSILYVSMNHKLSGHLPSFPIENKLEMLDISGTNFAADIPVSIVNLKSLNYLALTTRGISQELSIIGKLHSLRYLSLEGYGLERPEFSWIGDLGHLEDLRLYNYNFSESMPSWISNLTNIRYLQLVTCNFYGPIPHWIGNLTQLQYTEFDMNYLTGQIPRELFTLPKLQFLSLSSNQLSGHLEDIDNPSSSSLTIILLEYNQIGGAIPDSYLQLTSLEALSLGSNNLTGTVELTSFARLNKLRTLDLSNNMLSVIDGGDSSSLLPNIEILRLASCNLTEVPNVLRYLDKIQSLDLSSNHIHGVMPNWVWENWTARVGYLNLSHNMLTSLDNFTSLVLMEPSYIIDLSNNRLEGKIPIPMDRVRNNLMPRESGGILDYSNNYFNSIPPNFGKYLKETIYLDMSNNKLNGHIPTSVCTATKLEILDLSYNYFSGSIPSCLIQKKLRVLKLRGNRVHGVLPDNIREGCNLQTIDLSSNNITRKLPRSLLNCQDLGLLDVSNNQIVDSFPSWLGVLLELRVLVLRSNQFFGTIMDPQMNGHHFSSLQIIDLASNSFSGNIPECWFNKLKSMMQNDNGKVQVIAANSTAESYQDTITITFKGVDLVYTKILTTFKAIDFSNNLFDGSIPESVGRLVSLHGLNLSHNNFRGHIPSQLGNLTHLESMDLSWNLLSGEIPQELVSMTSLASLNLSYNNLTGRIPQENQFLSFPESSFEGNAGLCGRQLSKQCDNPSSTTQSPPAPIESNSFWQDRLDAILQFTSVGLGFGVGFALAVTLFQRFHHQR